MGALYLAALIFGFGVLGLQFVTGGTDGDGDHADGDHGDGDQESASDTGLIAVFLSLRFWTFALLAFGLVGSILHFFALASPIVTGIASSVMGLASGSLASFTFRFLHQTQVSSGAEARDAVGQVGRVLIPIERGKRGKVRIALRGQTVDLIASTDDERLQDGELVIVEELRGTMAHVSKAPREFLPE